MSRFLADKYESLTPYTPGEQPKDSVLVKLNTNESPYPPPPEIAEAVKEAAHNLQLYSDPDCTELRRALASNIGVNADNIICNNGSDETLYFAFLAYCDENCPAVFPDITYGFYPVFAEMAGVPFREIPLREDLCIAAEDYYDACGTIFIPNPNAPTGIPLSKSEIEAILAHNRDNMVVIDEAYVDFGTESAIGLTDRYDNLLVIRTFSKSKSLAGARLGYGIGNREIISDLNTLRFSTNPYNVSRLAMAAGIASLEHDEINRKNCSEVMKTRKYTVGRLRDMGFEMTESTANFIFIRHPDISGGELFSALRKKGVIIRHFNKDRISDYNRVTIGSPAQMEVFLRETEAILKESRG